MIIEGIPPRFDIEHDWMGVDFDGTLHYRERGVNQDMTADMPVPLMVEQIKHWLSLGMKVKILTARVNPAPVRGHSEEERLEYVKFQHELLANWCIKYIGEPLEATCSKDANMYQLWDDRAVCIERNTGRVLGISIFT